MFEEGLTFNGLLESLNSTCCLTLQLTINKFIQSHLPCEDILIMFLSEYANECVVQVVSDVVLEKEYRFAVPKRFDLKSVEAVEKDDEEINLFLKEKLMSVLYPYMEKLLKVPVKHPEKHSDIIFYIFLVNPAYTFETDEYNFSTTVEKCLDVCSAILLNAFTVKEEKQMKVLYQKLLLIGKACLLETGDYCEILSEIMTGAKKLTNTENCYLFILSSDKKVVKVYNGEKSAKMEQLEIEICHGIVGYVAVNGETVVLQKSQTQSLLPKIMEILPGLKIRNLLCFPVRDRGNRVVGVVTLVNKLDDVDFTYWDEEASGALSIYLGVALVHGALHRTIQISKAQDLLSVELITHHLTRRDGDFERIMKCNEKHNYDDMLDFRWISRSVSHSDTICYLVKMFDDLGLINLWKIQRKTLFTFFFGVRRGYRDLPYHNWSHGFSVAQFAYLLMHELKLLENILITGLEAVAFLVSALCHDLDHRGTTNGFQILSGNSLACLYGSEGSVMERHHFSYTLTLLNTDGCNIFENMTVEQYARALTLIRNMIVATDLAEYVKSLPEERNMSIMGYNPEKRAHRNLLLSLMMTCCDLNDQLKGWSHCRDIAGLIYSEFFMQGDMEKEMGNIPLPSMDREKAFIPELQLEFLTAICLPCYTVLSNVFPSMKDCVDAIEDTFKCWQGAIEWVKINSIPKNLFINYIFDPSLEDYVLQL